MNEKPIYPKVIVESGPSEFGQEIRATTFLRKEHEGKWYLQGFIKSGYFSEDRIIEQSLTVADVLERLHREVYISIVLGKVSLDLKYISLTGEEMPLFELDIYQTSEQQRVSELIYFGSRQDMNM